MAKNQEGAGAPEPAEKKTDGEGKAAGGTPPNEVKPAEQLAARICKTEATAREMFGRFALAVAGRDDANYRKAETIIDEAHRLTKLWEEGVKKYPDMPF